MCGRFGIYAESQEYNDQLGFSIRNGLFNFAPNYNATPSQMLPTLYRPDEDKPLLEALRWGLIPHWADDPKIGLKLFNARAETVHEKPSFREAFVKRRALIPVNGWYEWLRQDGVKQPYFHTASNNKLIWLAGLWEHWQDESGNSRIRSFTLLTQEAYGKAAIVHNRMPVIIQPEDYPGWLSPELHNKQDIVELLHSQPQQALHIYPVSTDMNKPQLNERRCIEPI